MKSANLQLLMLTIIFNFQAIVEQFSYTPFAMVSFFFGISILEMKSFKEACEEVRVKFFPTYQV